MSVSEDTGQVVMAVDPEQDESGELDQLIPVERSKDYGSQWNDVKANFVDDPQRAVADADRIVCELLDELEDLFRSHRNRLEGRSSDGEQPSPEELRVAFGHDDSFFRRLLAV